ncbi:hypothetical protein ADN00_18140 [Ornatilinea apprima]|uniref:Uncharacterized protein n=1 Tax=Ornatilinea apprima TaxID=1134406 RepID=A0A0P6XM53_9CHLR|nr:hypothetical protein ADN00_18140 [Ornatilinea apprima]
MPPLQDISIRECCKYNESGQVQILRKPPIVINPNKRFGSYGKKPKPTAIWREETTIISPEIKIKNQLNDQPIVKLRLK